jgi:4,5-dihydroxyphthalate decarboxylase
MMPAAEAKYGGMAGAAGLMDVTVAGGLYDRTVPLMLGWVRAAGISIRYVPLEIDDMFWRAFRYREFDATEISLAYYIALRSRGDTTYIAIPVFPSRFFRHGCIYVAADSSRKSLADLGGATVGVPEYSLTMCVWLRGLLQDEYGIEPSDISWRCGGIEAAGRRARASLPVPSDVDIASIEEGQTLTALLLDGSLDAIFSPRIPDAFWRGEIRRLLVDYRTAEHDYYRRTGIFPVMHAVAIKEELYKTQPWIARSLFDAFQDAKRYAYAWLADINALPVSLPWFMAEYEATRQVFGADPWEDGLTQNRRQLEVLCRYLRQQGLAEEISVDELFAPPTLDRAVV